MKKNRFSLRPVFLYIFLAVLFCGLVWFVFVSFPLMEHWDEIFRPAALNLVNGKNPYAIEKFMYPVWALIPIIPLAFLPSKIGSAIFSVLTLYGLVFVARRLGAKPLTAILFATLPQLLYTTVQVNLDWLVILGYILPPQIGLFFVLSKPQLGIGIAIFWFIKIWREKGFWSMFRVFTPFLIAFLLSFIFYGPWFMKCEITFLAENRNLWPLGIAIGLVLLVAAIRSQKMGLSIPAAQFMFPYAQPYSWPLGILGLLPDKILALTAIIGFWLMVLKQKWMLLTIIDAIFKH